jgi:hypothetical protein
MRGGEREIERKREVERRGEIERKREVERRREIERKRERERKREIERKRERERENRWADRIIYIREEIILVAGSGLLAATHVKHFEAMQ